MVHTRMSKAVVVGAGIGGLTAAVALHQQGWDVTVLERADSLAPVGAGIGLAPNSQRALDAIGLGDQVRNLSAWQGDGGLRDPRGRWLNRTDSEAAAERFGGPLVVVHRATLVDLLVSALPGGAVRTGTAAVLTDPGDERRPALVTTAVGGLEADLVVGADGIHSAVRGTLFPAHPGPRYSGFTTWRVVIPAPDTPFAPHETWGRGRLWGTQPLKDGRVYAYAAALAPEGERAADDERAELLRRFGDWHRPIPDVVAAAEPAQVLRHDVHHMAEPLPAYHHGRVALVGDAAHAMQPTLGQGGNQAIEDGIVLAHHAGRGPDVADGLGTYTRERLPRTMGVVRLATRIGRVALHDGAVGVAVRDALIRAVSRFGPGLVLRGFDGIADWEPPTRPCPAGAAPRHRGHTDTGHTVR
ncbi:FAD-dependent monooxygenase [Streptomyces sp. NPDC127084]|uniref:FAD-dependent monooxygenase n=1 Tax=Streptomyces sp. NPDC127084 TaxID=3347133 RepID=UPI0036540BF8